MDVTCDQTDPLLHDPFDPPILTPLSPTPVCLPPGHGGIHLIVIKNSKPREKHSRTSQVTMNCRGNGKCFGTSHRSAFLVAALILLLQWDFTWSSYFDENGNYVMCGTTPEMLGPRMTLKIRGGLNMLHKHPRQECSKRTSEEDRYRTYDGTCNNPGNRGATFSFLKRLVPPAYHGSNGPRQYGKDFKQLPNPRLVSRTIHTGKSDPSNHTLLVMQIGQLLDHDLSVIGVPTERNNTIKCCGVPLDQRYHDCFPIEILSGDLYFKNCMEFVRSEPARLRNGSIISPRRHENVLTSFIDASMVYGSDLAKVLKLRDNDGKEALLKTSFYQGKERLPKGNPDVCINDGPDHYCALAGDDRVNEQPGLTAIHTVFHLEHNRLVRKLAADILVAQGQRYTPLDIAAYLKTAPLHVQEKLFQTVRRILIAVWQKIVYGEYLPIILGPDIMTKFQLWTGSRVNFDPHVDPSISNAFSSAAFRFGHTLIANVFHMDKDHILKDMFSESSHILEHYESMCVGLVSWNNAAGTFNRHLADSITNHLFANNRMNKTGLDLASLNLQRGRDHGTAGINAYRKYFGLRPYHNFNQFWDCALDLRTLYSHPDDVDLFTGGTCERSVKNGIVGETFAHILGQQFHDLKFGDKYFFETSDQRYGFTTDQLISITKLSMSKILCSNGAISYIQEKPFHQANYYHNPLVPCDELPDIDLTYWVSEFSY